MEEEDLIFVLLAYDVRSDRTELYRKLLSRYLVHEQTSVFMGDLPESKVARLHFDLAKILADGDRVIEVHAANRHNVDVDLLSKAPNGLLIRKPHSHHRSRSVIL